MATPAMVKSLKEATDIIHKEAIRLVQEGAIPPPLKEKSIENKGSSKTLIDDGWLLGALEEGMKITEEGDKILAEVGIFDPEIARYAAVHEYGYPPVGEDTLEGSEGQRVPTRSFLRRAWDNKITEAEAALKGSIDEQMALVFRSK
jgi:hypothetical protein